MSRKVAKVEDVEQLLVELDKLYWNIEDDSIKSGLYSLIEDICKDREICEKCYKKVDEVWLDDGLHRKCDCEDKIISGYQEAV